LATKVKGAEDSILGLGSGDGRTFETLTEALAVTPIPADNVPFQVSETGDPDNAGYYFYKDGGAVDGKAEFSRGFVKKTNVIEEGNTDAAESGAVYESLRDKTDNSDFYPVQ